MPESLIAPTIADMEETIPEWLEYFKNYRDGAFAKRIPLNRSEITAEKEHVLMHEMRREQAEHDWVEFEQKAQERRLEEAQLAREREAQGADQFAFLDGGFQDPAEDTDTY